MKKSLLAIISLFLLTAVISCQNCDGFYDKARKINEKYSTCQAGDTCVILKGGSTSGCLSFGCPHAINEKNAELYLKSAKNLIDDYEGCQGESEGWA